MVADGGGGWRELPGKETRNPDGGEGCGPKVEAAMLITEAMGK